MKVQEIPIDKIKENPYQMRKEIDEDKIKILAKSIRERGLFNPITVIKENEDYITVNGHRRILAFKKLNKKTIPAFVKNRHKDQELVFDLIHENLMQEHLTPVEKANSVRLLLSTIKETNNDIDKMISLINLVRRWQGKIQDINSKRETFEEFKEEDMFRCLELLKSIGVSMSGATTYLSILKLPTDIQDKVIFGAKIERGKTKDKINLYCAQQLARVSNDPGLLNYLFEKAKSGSTSRVIQTLVDQHIKNKEKNLIKGKKTRLHYKNRRIDFELIELSKHCNNLAQKISSFKVTGLIKMSTLMTKEEFDASMLSLQKEIKWLNNAIKERLKEKGCEVAKEEIEPFEVRVGVNAERNFKNPRPYNFRFTFPSRIVKALNITKPTFVKLKVMEIKK